MPFTVSTAGSVVAFCYTNLGQECAEYRCVRAICMARVCIRHFPDEIGSLDWYKRVVGFLDKVLKSIASEIVWKYLLEKETFGKIFRDLLPDRGRLNLILYSAPHFSFLQRARFGYADEKLDGGMM